MSSSIGTYSLLWRSHSATSSSSTMSSPKRSAIGAAVWRARRSGLAYSASSGASSARYSARCRGLGVAVLGQLGVGGTDVELAADG